MLARVQPGILALNPITILRGTAAVVLMVSSPKARRPPLGPIADQQIEISSPLISISISKYSPTTSDLQASQVSSIFI
jgi:hypothetical protein